MSEGLTATTEFGSVRVNPETLALEFSFHQQAWSTTRTAPHEITLGIGARTVSYPLAAAQKKELSAYQIGTGTGLRIGLSGFPESDLRLTAFVLLNHRHPEVSIRIIAQENGTSVRELRWPGPLTLSPAGSKPSTTLPLMQGALLPGDWPKDLDVVGQATCRPWYMPWWGQQHQGAGYIAILETFADACIAVKNPPGGPAEVGVRWSSSLGHWGYQRSIKYAFLNPCDFNTQAKYFRSYLKSKGEFVTLEEKCARTPKLRQLLGSPVVHTLILRHIQPESRFFKPDEPAKNHCLTTFEAKAGELRKLHALGVEKAYVHLDGWGLRGYDNLHPDILPPCPEAGGWEGLRGLVNTCHELGYLMVLHDQYDDYYCDASSFDFRHAQTEENGTVSTGSAWAGGKQATLCNSHVFEYVRRNHQEIRRNGVAIDGAYLDLFSGARPDECFHPEHPMTRAECLDFRRQCFGFIRDQGGLISSEEPSAWAAPYLHLVHHGPNASYPKLHTRGPAVGIPLPLFNLVFHDSLVIPWQLDEANEWVWGPESDRHVAHAAMQGAMPYLSLNPTPGELETCRELCRLQERVAMQELIEHELLDEKGRRRRSTFANGVKVEVDLDSGAFEIGK